MRNGQNIRIVEGNSFQLVCPISQRVFVDGVPVDTAIDATTLEQVVVKVNGVEWQSVALEQEGVVVGFSSTLEKNTYNIEITATNEGAHIRSAWFEAFTIVAFNEQSDMEDYLAGSPLTGTLPTAYITGGSIMDEIIEAIWEATEYLQGADADATLTAILAAIAPKATSAEVEAAKNAIIAAMPDIPTDYAKELTAQAILTAVRNLPTVQQIQAGLATEANATANKTTILNAIAALVIPTVAQIQNGLAKEAQATLNKNAILNAIAALVIPSVEQIQNGLAKQGNNASATNTAILAAIGNIPEQMKMLYSVNFVRNGDGTDTYTMVLPVTAGVTAVGDNITITM